MKYRLKFMSSSDVIKQSYGEVKYAETFNTRSLEPIPGGLMCQSIFGPIRDYQCACGNIKGRRYRGTKCINCGVEIISSYSRAKRSGHIHLPFPVLNPLATSIVSDLLGISINDLKRVLYDGNKLNIIESSTGSIVIDGVQSYVEISDTLGSKVTESNCVGLYDILSRVDLDASLNVCSEKVKPVINSLISNYNKDTSVLFVQDIMVLPPEYRPEIKIDGNWVSDTVNELYLRVLRRRENLNSILEYDPPTLILRLELCLLQQAIDQLFIGGYSRKRINYKSLIESISRKGGLIRNNLLGKRVDYSARSVITVGPELKLDEVSIPLDMAYELFSPFILGKVKRENGVTFNTAKRLYNDRDELALNALDDLVSNYRVMVNRHPTLHKFGIQGMKVSIHNGKSIKMNPLICACMNADFDGDTASVHLPLSIEALEECKTLMSPVNNLLNPLDSSQIATPTHEAMLGLYLLTAIKDVDNPKMFATKRDLEYLQQIGEIKPNCGVYVGGEYTCLGRIWIGDILGVSIKEPLTKRNIKEVLNKAYSSMFSNEDMATALSKLKDLGFEYSTKMGHSLGIDDFSTPSSKKTLFEKGDSDAVSFDDSLTSEQANEAQIRNWINIISKLNNEFLEEGRDSNPLAIMTNIGVRASIDQVSQMVVAKGMVSDLTGKISPAPIKHSYKEGLDTVEYFLSTKGSRKGLADKKFATPKSGYLARKLAMVARDLRIVGEDCGTYNRITVNGEKLRSPVTCEQKGGICKKCYGNDPSTGRLPAIGSPVGIVAAQALAEPATQMTMRTFHTGGAAKLTSGPKTIQAKNSGKVAIRYSDGVAIISIGEDEYFVHGDARIFVEEGQYVNEGNEIATYTTAIKQEDVTGKLPLLTMYYEMSNPKVPCVVSGSDGNVNLKTGIDRRGRSVVYVYVNDKFQGTVIDQPLFVINNEAVKKGQVLSYGETNLRSLLARTDNDLDLLTKVFVNRMKELYAEEGVYCDKIHLEVILRAMTEVVKRQDSLYGLRSFDDYVDIVPMGVSNTNIMNPSWLKAMGFGWVKQVLTNAAINKRSTYGLGTEKIMTGELIQQKESNG